MIKEDSSLQPLFILSLTLLLLGAMFFLPLELIQKFDLKKTNILSDVLRKEESKIIRKRRIVRPAVALANISNDSIFCDRNVLGDTVVNLVGDTSCGLAPFYRALASLGKGTGKNKVRIAYFGDSVIEGDLITENLRRLFQNSYGGRGVGFVPITSAVATFRKTIIHTYSPTWNSVSLVAPNYKGHDVGITGYGFFAPCDSISDSTHIKYTWAKYWSVKNSNRLNKFDNIKLFYGSSNKASKVLFYNGEQSFVHHLEGKGAVNELTLSTSSSLHTSQVGIHSASRQNIFGLSFESDTGIVLDNFSLRGNSGLALQRIPSSTLAGFQDLLDYDLIILHYGLNALNSTYSEFDWYGRGMDKVIAHLKKAFPNTAILIVGISDKSTKVDGSFVTEPNLKYLLEAQFQLAHRHHTAFFNLYEGMGGENSMVSWATADTALANKDYTHFNFRGAEKISQIIYQWMNENYNDYRKINH